MLVSYSYPEFFQYKPGLHFQAFDELVFECFRKKGELIFTLKNNRVDIEVKAQSKASNAIHVFVLDSNLSPSGDFFEQSLSTGTKMVLPLFVDFKSISIPYHQILALRRGKRTIADFCTRNLFYATCREDNVVFQALFASDLDLLTPSQDISIRYLWVLRSIINDPFLKRKDIMEKILINLYFQIFSFENNLLESGCEEIRDYYSNNIVLGGRKNHFDQGKRFMQVRESVMACFA